MKEYEEGQIEDREENGIGKICCSVVTIHDAGCLPCIVIDEHDRYRSFKKSFTNVIKNGSHIYVATVIRVEIINDKV